MGKSTLISTFRLKYLESSTVRNLVLKEKLPNLCPVRFYSKIPERAPRQDTDIPEEEHYGGLQRQASFRGVQVKYWNERRAVRQQRKAGRFPWNVQNSADVLKFLQSWNNFPVTLLDLLSYLRRRWVRNQLAEQKFLPERVAVLKPDLAAAHFLVRRGGQVKFVGSPNWVGFGADTRHLPFAYVPGMFIEAIKAEGTQLFYEGLENLDKLRYLTSLSLKNLSGMNDWCMDHISKQHYLNLKHLDISGCKNITYRGLSCFYRFECLETLNVEGIPDTPEFKVACLMLLEIMPDLEIKGIDLSIPEKIDPVNLNSLKDPKVEIPDLKSAKLQITSDK